MRITKIAAQRYCMPIALVFGSIASNAVASEADISVSENEISVVARQAKLSEILVELGNQADIAVIDAQTIDGTFDGEVSGATIESVLNQLGVNSIFVWNNSDDDRMLKEIIVLSAAEEDSQFLPSGETQATAAAQSETEANQDAQADTTAAVTTSSAGGNSAADDSSAPDSSTGFGFSIDPSSETINQQ
jgi:hypothetical protein